MEKIIITFCCYYWVSSFIKCVIFYYSFIRFLFDNIKTFLDSPYKHIYFYKMSIQSIMNEEADINILKKYGFKILNPFYLNFKKVKFIESKEFLKMIDRQYFENMNLVKGDDWSR